MESRWISGAYRPRTDEVVERNLRVTGELPRELAGRLVRISPNPPGRVGSDYEWFAGAGMVHAVRLEDGRALEYRNRWVRTPEVSRALGEAPLCDPLPFFDTANTHVIPFGGELLAMTETCLPYRLDLDLATLGREDFGAIERFTAHPHVDPVTGELHAVGYAADDEPLTTYWVIDSDGKARQKRDVSLAASAFVHDFALTRRHVVFYDLPLRFHPGDAAAGKTIPYRWDTSGSAHIGVLRRDRLDDPVRWIEIEPCWIFHTLNAYDGPDDEIVIDLVRFDRFYDQDRTGPGDPFPPSLHRFTIDAGRTRVADEPVDERPQEFPRLDERFFTRRHRYGYTTQLLDADARGGVLLHDFVGAESAQWLTEPGERMSEVVFVARSETAREGEGWLLGLRTGGQSAGAELLVFEAEALSEGPVARVEIPHRIPVDVHGSWVSASNPGGGCWR